MTPHAEITKVPAKWRWHHRVLQKLRDHLLDERAVELAEAAHPIEPHSMDQADSATDEFNRALAVSLLSGEQDALYEVDAAMRRITAGTYGICEKTGKRIPMQRLRAVPWTRFTKEAEEAFEREGAAHRIGLAKAESIQGPESRGLAEAEQAQTEDLPTQMTARHQLAETLKTFEAEEEPAREELPPARPDGKDGSNRPRLRTRPSARPKPRKSGR